MLTVSQQKKTPHVVTPGRMVTNFLFWQIVKGSQGSVHLETR